MPLPPLAQDRGAKTAPEYKANGQVWIGAMRLKDKPLIVHDVKKTYNVSVLRQNMTRDITIPNCISRSVSSC